MGVNHELQYELSIYIYIYIYIYKSYSTVRRTVPVQYNTGAVLYRRALYYRYCTGTGAAPSGDGEARLGMPEVAVDIYYYSLLLYCLLFNGDVKVAY